MNVSEVPGPPQRKKLKVDFHLHSAEDPKDVIHHSAADLLYQAHKLGFNALAFTLHDHVLTKPELFELARELGILLIPAAEMRLDGADVVILNISEEEAVALNTLDDLKQLRARRGNTVFLFAPHPYFIFGGSIGKRVEEHIELFDAIEYSHFHTRWLNLNQSAVHLAQKYRKPLLATSDTHRMDFFGDHYSLVELEGEVTPQAVFDAIRAGQAEWVSPAWSIPKFLQYIRYIFLTHPFYKILDQL